jgi:hypothetical protein
MEAKYFPKRQLTLDRLHGVISLELFRNNIIGLSRLKMSHFCTTENIRHIDRKSLRCFWNALHFVINPAMTAPFK